MKEDQHQLKVNYLVDALLCGEGEISISLYDNKFILYAPVPEETVNYIFDYLGDTIHKLNINYRKGELIVQSHYLARKKLAWYKNRTKIFSALPDSSRLHIESVFLLINIYGHRQTDGIVIRSNVDRLYLKILAYSLNEHISVNFMVSNFSIKIYHTPKLINEFYLKASIIHIVPFMRFITYRELKERNTVNNKGGILIEKI